MKSFTKFFVLVFIVGQITCPPVKEQKKGEENNENEIPTDKDDLENYMEYSRYLKEVVNALESDPDFRQKLEKAEEADIRSGKIAHELEFVSHHVRNRLDEIKRSELERLRHLAAKKMELENGIDSDHMGKVNSISNEHLDHANPHTFEIEDLKKLIAKTSQDLAEADRKRREEFKQYEMQKEFEKKEKLKSLDDVQRLEMEKHIKEQEEKHKQHPKLHHPGSKQQLEEVWEKEDHMNSQQFDPKTFFMLHDLDGNGHWDQTEVKALFLKELDKLYQAGAPEDDMRERAEEMERMREHVFSEADVNRDGLISFNEFLEQTKRPDFNQDPGWDGLDQQRVYTQEEYQEFERQRIQEIERLIAQGMLPPNPHGYPPQAVPHHPGQFPPQAQYHHPSGQAVPVHPNAIPQQGYHPQQHPAATAQQNQQYNQGKIHPGQVNPNIHQQAQQYQVPHQINQQQQQLYQQQQQQLHQQQQQQQLHQQQQQQQLHQQQQQQQLHQQQQQQQQQLHQQQQQQLNQQQLNQQLSNNIPVNQQQQPNSVLNNQNLPQAAAINQNQHPPQQPQPVADNTKTKADAPVVNQV